MGWEGHLTPELARFGPGSNAFWRVGACRDSRRRAGEARARRMARRLSQRAIQPRAPSNWVESEGALDSLFDRIFCGKPVSTFPENAQPLHNRQANIDIAAGGVGIGAYLVRLLHQRLGLGARNPGQGDVELDVQAKTAGRARPD